MRSLDVDFVRQPSPWSRGGWVLGVGIAALFLAIWQLKALTDQAEALQRLAQVQDNAGIGRNKVQAPPPPSYADDLRWRRAAHELAYPWVDTLEAVEGATKPPIYLLSMSTDASTGLIRIEAEAPKYDDALAYLSPLRNNSHLASAELLSHETAQDASGRSFVRVVVETHWVAN